MKKTLALILALVMVFALCACGSTSTQTTNTPTQASATSTAATSSNPSEPINQVNLFYQNINSLRSDDATRTFWYTITDLDHNGRLEFVSAITEGTGNTTSANAYEIGSDYASINQISIKNTNDFLPEIIVKSTDVLVDSNGYHYVYTDTNSDAINGGGHYISKGTLTLSNGTIDSKIIASQDVSYMGGYTVYTTYDGNGVEQDPTNFSIESATTSAYPNATKSTANFDWFSISEATSPARLYSSYCTFAGQIQPSTTSTPITTATPAATSTIKIVDVTNPTVTKSPTSESVTAGGSCSFIAQAIGYNYMKWQFISPSGVVYDASTTNPFPASLYVYGATGQTLTLSNIPIDMDGWKAQAVFYGDTESVTSAPATVYVSAAPTPVYVTISFSPSSGSSFYDTLQYVTVYSSNGQDIRVEATMSGDTGCYYSNTIPSGSAFPVQGIAGQSIYVNVIATCANSQANATYYVNCTPITPTPDPEPYTPPMPTSNPGGSSKTGYVDSINTEGGGYYVGVTFDDGTYGRYDISYMVSNPPSVGQRCTVSFASDGITITEFSYS